MKTQYILPILFSLGTALLSSQVGATGLTYDPCENYYHDNYGIDFSMSPSSITETEEVSNDPNADYYKTYYGTYLEDISDNSKTVEPKSIAALDNQEMANPLNFYNW